MLGKKTAISDRDQMVIKLRLAFSLFLNYNILRHLLHFWRYMPGRLWSPFIFIFWFIFFTLAFLDKWNERGQSEIRADRLFSTEASLRPREELVILDPTLIGKQMGKNFRRVESRMYIIPEVLLDETIIHFSVTTDGTQSLANGMISYDTVGDFSRASISWMHEGQERGLIASRISGGKLGIDAIGSLKFKSSRYDYPFKQTFSIDPTMAVAVPHLRTGESWVINSFLWVLLKALLEVQGQSAGSDLQLKAVAVRREQIEISNGKMWVMRVEVGTYGGSSSTKVFTSWVSNEGVVMKSEFAIAGVKIEKKFVQWILPEEDSEAEE
jgi:hypothetical protein